MALLITLTCAATRTAARRLAAGRLIRPDSPGDDDDDGARASAEIDATDVKAAAVPVEARAAAPSVSPPQLLARVQRLPRWLQRDNGTSTQEQEQEQAQEQELFYPRKPVGHRGSVFLEFLSKVF